MVCISCFLAPVVLFIWYKFIYPVLQPLINRFFAGYELPTPFQNLVCPMPQKNKTDKKEDDNNETNSATEQTEMKCPFASGASTIKTSDDKKDD